MSSSAPGLASRGRCADPLDITGLIAAGRGGTWDGAPMNTTMGHVHLHVGNLDYPGALFLSAGGYHHHLGTNVWAPGPAHGTDDARLLAWELIAPSQDDVLSGAQSLRGAGYRCNDTERGVHVADPWGTAVHLRARE